MLAVMKVLVLCIAIVTKAVGYVGTLRPHAQLLYHKRMLLQSGAEVSSSITTPNPDLWRQGYRNCDSEVCQVLNGSVPLDLVGTYYRNAHGQFTIGKDTIAHPFDADGMVCAFTFQNGTTLFRNRFVRTNGFLAERRQKRILFRGAFGTQIPGGPLANVLRTSLKNPANTNVLYFANRLLALWESGNPYLLEADSLRTLSSYTFRGTLARNEPFTAHPKIDPVTGHLLGFSYQPTPFKTVLKLFDFDPSLKLHYQRKLELPGFAMFHDMAVTKQYFIFLQSACSFNPLPFLLGIQSAASCVKFLRQPSKVILVPRSAQDDPITVDIDECFAFHLANAFETDTGEINLDVVASDNMLLVDQQLPSSADSRPIWETFQWKDLPKSTLRRYIIPLNNKSADSLKQTQFRRRDLYSALSCELPTLNPQFLSQNAKYIYLLTPRPGPTPYNEQHETGTGPFQRVVMVDTVTGNEVDSYTTGMDDFVGEAVFAPRESGETRGQEASEDYGYLLVMTLNPATNTSTLLILDAQRLSSGPVAQLSLPTFISYGLHGQYVPGLVVDREATQRKFKAFSALDKQNWNTVNSAFSGLGISYDF